MDAWVSVKDGAAQGTLGSWLNARVARSTVKLDGLRLNSIDELLSRSRYRGGRRRSTSAVAFHSAAAALSPHRRHQRVGVGTLMLPVSPSGPQMVKVITGSTPDRVGHADTSWPSVLSRTGTGNHWDAGRDHLREALRRPAAIGASSGRARHGRTRTGVRRSLLRDPVLTQTRVTRLIWLEGHAVASLAFTISMGTVRACWAGVVHQSMSRSMSGMISVGRKITR